MRVGFAGARLRYHSERHDLASSNGGDPVQTNGSSAVAVGPRPRRRRPRRRFTTGRLVWGGLLRVLQRMTHYKHGDHLEFKLGFSVRDLLATRAARSRTRSRRSCRQFRRRAPTRQGRSGPGRACRHGRPQRPGAAGRADEAQRVAARAGSGASPPGGRAAVAEGRATRQAKTSVRAL